MVELNKGYTKQEIDKLQIILGLVQKFDNIRDCDHCACSQKLSKDIKFIILEKWVQEV